MAVIRLCSTDYSFAEFGSVRVFLRKKHLTNLVAVNGICAGKDLKAHVEKKKNDR